MPRTTNGAVKALLVTGKDYDEKRLPNLDVFIESAYTIVTKVKACAAAKGEPLTAIQLELIERWLSAHYYTKADPLYGSRSTSGASGSFVQGTEGGERYRAVAIELDTSGCLGAILKRQTATAFWAGKTEPEMLDYDERMT